MDEEKSHWPARAGLILAIVVASGAGLWLLPDAIHQHAAELQLGDFSGIATMLGVRLAAIVAIVFLVLYVLALRGWGLERGIIYLMVLAFVVADVDAAVVYATKTAGHERSFRFNTQAVADLKSAVQNFHGFGNQDASDEALRERAANDSRIIAGISANEAAQLTRVHEQYLLEVSRIIGTGLLKPSSLAETGGIQKAHARLLQARALVKKYRAAEQKVFADTRSIVRQAQVDQSVRAQMLAAFDRSLRQRSSVIQKLWDCEDQLFAESDQMVLDISHAQSEWRPRGDAFVFTSRHDLNLYDGHVRKLQEIVGTERILAAESPDIAVTTIQSRLPSTN